jgi:HSP20 family protein
MNATKKETQPVRETPAERETVSPDVNIYELNEEYLLEAELPGVTKDGLEVTLEDNVLTLVGRRQDRLPKGEAVYRESRRADFRRSFELDPMIDAEKIAARVEQGVLTLRLPKGPAAKPRRIMVTE